MEVDLSKHTEITDVSFDHENAHLAVVHESQGGAANGWHVALLTKAKEEDVSEEIIKALEQVTVKLSMEEFLRKFFDMWYDDAELLTKFLGFETEYEYYLKENETLIEEFSYSDYLESRVEKFEIMKSALDSKDYSISPADSLEILKTQMSFEKSLETAEEEILPVDSVSGGDNEELNKSSDKSTDNEISNDEVNVDINEVLKSAEALEIIEKAKADAVAEAVAGKDAELEKAAEELTKATEELEVFKSERDAKRKEGIAEFVKSLTFVEEDSREAVGEVIFKSVAMEGMDVIVSVLEKAQEEITSAKKEFVKSEEGYEVKDDEVEIDKSVELADRLEAKYAGKDFL